MSVEILSLLNLKLITTVLVFYLVYVNGAESESKDFEIFIGSFNVAGFNPEKSEKKFELDLTNWIIQTKSKPDPTIKPNQIPESYQLPKIESNKNSDDDFAPIYVIGLQELVEIKFFDKIKEYIYDSIENESKKTQEQNKEAWGSLLLKTIRKNYEKHDYIEIRCLRKYGTVIYIFVPKSVWNTPGNLLNMDADSIKVGSALKGCSWDKGAVAVRFELYGISLCFICAHLTSYSGKINERNVDFKKVNDEILFENQIISKKIVDHDYIFFFGDLNYRINSEGCKDEINCLWNTSSCTTDLLPLLKNLHEYDQLTLELRSNRDTIVDSSELDSKSVFMMGYREDDKIQKIIPTYMYQIELGQGDSNTDEPNQKWKTTSNPAWCDRVLYKIKKPDEDSSEDKHKLKILRYESVNGYLISDHRPIFSIFKIEHVVE